MQGTPRFMMPAFSKAIFSTVSPSFSAWSIEIGVMTVEGRGLNDVGRIEAAAEADLEQNHIGR